MRWATVSDLLNFSNFTYPLPQSPTHIRGLTPEECCDCGRPVAILEDRSPHELVPRVRDRGTPPALTQGVWAQAGLAWHLLEQDF